MKSAVLNRAPGAGSRRTKKKKEEMTKLYSSPPKVLFRDPIGHELPPSLQNFRWNVDKVERKLQEKIQEKTLIAGNFVYQQAYRLLEGSRGEGIDFLSFKEQLRVKFGIILDDGELHLLFDKYDEDRNGTIDLHEFIRRVLPPDYNYGQQWFELSQLESDGKAKRLRNEARQEFLACQGQRSTKDVTNVGATSNWTLDELKKQIQAKVVQKTPSGEDQYRRAFKMLRSGRDQGIQMSGLQFNLKTRFGIYASDEQMRQLFLLCDQDGNGEIDLKEFLQFVDPPAYPSNSRVPGGLWTHSDSEDEDESIASGEVGNIVDVPIDATERRLRLRMGSVSARCTPREGSVASASSEEGIVGVSQLTRVKKERPRTADPRKTQMLQQRREKLEQQRIIKMSARQNFHPTTLTSMVDIHRHHLEALSLASDEGIACTHPVISSQTPRLRRSDSVKSVHSEEGRTCPPRPRSAGSVRSYASSSVGSVTCSLKGAVYMKRPATPQSLRQKCLESRAALAATAAEAKTKTRMKKVRVAQLNTEQNPRRSNRVPVVSRDTERRHSFSSSGDCGGNKVCCCKCTCVTKDNYAPRIVRVHAKQHNARPYSAEGRTIHRSKVLSSGCL